MTGGGVAMECAVPPEVLLGRVAVEWIFGWSLAGLVAAAVLGWIALARG